MFCSKCGKRIPDDSKFCNYCGRKINLDEDGSKGVAKKPKGDAKKPKMSETVPLGADSEHNNESSRGAGLDKTGKAVKRKLSAVSAQAGASVRAKAKAIIGDSCAADSELDSKESAAFEKEGATGKFELSASNLSTIFIVLLFISAITFVSVPRDDSQDESELTSTASTNVLYSDEDASALCHDVLLFVEFDSNWFFDKYDVEVSVDGKMLGTLPHGEDGSYEIELADGEHTFSVRDTDGAGRIGSAKFDATNLSVVGFNIDIGNAQIYIERLDTVVIPLGTSETIGMPRQEVEDAFRDAGFDNITCKELGDLPLDQTEDADTVSSVTVRNSDSFAAGEVMFPDDEVIISVHTPAKIKAPVSSTALLGMNYEDAREKLEAAGFTAVCSPASLYDKDYGDWEVNEVAVDELFASDDFEDGTEFGYGTTIKLYYNEPQAEEEPDEWDQERAARHDFENFGEILYPYGFKCHWIVDLIAWEPQGDGTFFIKVGVTITNEYGVEIDTYAQGIAGNGSVSDFWVS